MIRGSALDFRNKDLRSKDFGSREAEVHWCMVAVAVALALAVAVAVATAEAEVYRWQWQQL